MSAAGEGAMTAPAHVDGAPANGSAAKPVRALALPDGNCLAIERVPAANHDCHQARVGVFLDETHRYISTRAANTLALALKRRESCASEGVAVWRRPVRDAHEDPTGIWLVLRREDGHQVGVRLLGSHADAVAGMFSRAEFPTAEEIAQSCRREQAERLAEQLAREVKQRAKVRELEELERERCAEWRRRHAPHLRVPPASLPDVEPDGFEHDYRGDEEPSAVVPIAPRLAIHAGGRPIVISGGPGAMKSFVSSEIALSVALGELHAFGGEVPIKQRGYVVHLDWENPGAHRTMQRYRRLAGDGYAVLEDGVWLANGVLGLLDVRAPTVFLDDPRAEKALTQLLYGAVICIIDSIQFACRHHSEHYSAALATLGRVSALTGCAILVILHPVKGFERRQGLDRLDFVTGREFDTALWLEKDVRQVTTITSVKNANGAGPIEPLRVRLVDEGGVDSLTGLSDQIRFQALATAGSDHRVASTAERVRRRIMEALADGPLTGKKLRAKIKGGNEAILDELNAMRAEGIVVLDEEGRFALAQGCPSRSVDGPARAEIRNEIMVRSFLRSEVETAGTLDIEKVNGSAVLRGPDRSVDRVVRGPLPPKGEGRVPTPKKKKGAA